MTLAENSTTAPPPRAARENIGRVLAVSGAQVTIGLIPPAPGSMSRATVGKFLGVVSGTSVIIGLITEVSERTQRDQDPNCRSTARLDVVGEIKANGAGAAHFQRGITEYPTSRCSAPPASASRTASPSCSRRSWRSARTCASS